MITSSCQVVLSPTHLAIVMEYAAGGELFQQICKAGRFSEDKARYFFQQLISGLSYCHAMQVCHCDLKLENTLLDGSPAPRLKICDFGYSKSLVLHSQPKSTVGTPAYNAPEILQRREQEYDGKKVHLIYPKVLIPFRKRIQQDSWLSFHSEDHHGRYQVSPMVPEEPTNEHDGQEVDGGPLPGA